MSNRNSPIVIETNDHPCEKDLVYQRVCKNVLKRNCPPVCLFQSTVKGLMLLNLGNLAMPENCPIVSIIGEMNFEKMI